jgi:hypothetical protein
MSLMQVVLKTEMEANGPKDVISQGTNKPGEDGNKASKTGQRR